MAKSKAASLWTHFESLEEPRATGRNFRHPLKSVLVMTVVAYACGMKSLEACAHFARMQKDWFEKYLELPHGVPSHDVFRNVFSLLDSEAFERCFSAWTHELHNRTEGDIVPVDGKTIRRSGSPSQRALHLVSAWSKLNGIVLGQTVTEEKSNEITAIPALIESLAIEGCIVTIDAMGCQTEIAQCISEKGAHYVLAVKDNQKALHDELKTHFALAESMPANIPSGPEAPTTTTSEFSYFSEADKGHGRVETREVWVSDNTEALVEAERWPFIASVVRVDSERVIKDKKTKETRYYISSLSQPSAEKMFNAIRSHWEIENKLHWCLDVTMNEDGACLRERTLAENGAVVRRIALNALRTHPAFDGNLARATRNAAFDLPFRETLISKII